MRVFEGEVRRTRMLVPVLTSLIFASVPLAALAGPYDAIPDSEITADQFDGTIAFTPDDDADAAMPPLEVHEVDASQATAAGATKVVDGKAWLDADEYTRNDILNEVEDAMPDGTDLVIDVSTGDIWQVPLADGALLPDAFRLWTDEEYYWLDDGWDTPRIVWSALTRKKFLKITEVGQNDNGEQIDPLGYFKTIGPVGHSEIRSLQGFQVALMATWNRESPEQRLLRLVMLKHYYSRLPQFQSAENRLIFALMVPEGALFAIPYFQYRYMLARSGIQPLSLYDMAMLPVVLTLVDRQIRGDYQRLRIAPLKEP